MLMYNQPHRLALEFKEITKITILTTRVRQVTQQMKKQLPELSMKVACSKTYNKTKKLSSNNVTSALLLKIKSSTLKMK